MFVIVPCPCCLLFWHDVCCVEHAPTKRAYMDGAIAFARVDAAVTDELFVDIRGKKLPVEIVKPPFARLGKSLI